MGGMLLSWAFFLVAGTRLCAAASAPPLPDSQIAVVKQRLAEGALLSWELGTRAQALLELDAPKYSVFSPTQPIPQNADGSIADVLKIAKDIVYNRTHPETTPTSTTTRASSTSASATSSTVAGSPTPSIPIKALMKDDAAADPASNGVAVLLAAWTNQGSQDGLDYMGAVKDQIKFLTDYTPKSSDGAISHRVPEVQLWSDFVYMVPPLFASYGVQTNDKTFITAAYDQIKLYRQHLSDPSAGNLWKHVVLGSNRTGFPANDLGYWSTGNGWAAAGMLRVLATIKYSSFADEFKNEQNDLVTWTNDIHKAVYAHVDKGNIFSNYIDTKIKTSTAPGHNTSFYDAAGTALLASTVYRIATLGEQYHYVPHAEAARQTLWSTKSDGSYNHFDSDGWLTPVVNPHWYGALGSKSPEGQAFVVLLQATHRDWVQAGSKGMNSGRRSVSFDVTLPLLALLSVVFWILF